MKTYVIIPAILIMATFLSCSTDEEPDQGYVVATSITLSLVNENGQDLLNPETPGYYNPEDITLYSLEGNEKKRMFSANLDFPKHFRILEKNGEFSIHIMPDHDDNQKTYITLIEWNENDVDTLKTDIYSTTNYIGNDKVWFNDNLIWQREGREDKVESYAEIIK